MEKIGFAMLVALMIICLIPFVTADAGGSVGLNLTINSSGFEPLIWMDPDARIFLRSAAGGGEEMIERVDNYAFEGEQVAWNVLVMDKNGIEDIEEVRVIAGPTQGSGTVTAICDLDPLNENTGLPWADLDDITQFNARIDQELLTELDLDTMAVYDCILTVETPNSMYGQYWVVGEVEDEAGNTNTFDENEGWYFNPVISLTIGGGTGIDFGGDAIPGSMAYSNTLTITNAADAGSGVLLDMQISGSDFYDSTSVGAKCPVTNRLKLNNGGTAPAYNNDGPDIFLDPTLAGRYARGDQSNCDIDGDLGVEGADGVTGVDPLCYYATNGAYSTNNDATRADVEGYVGIAYDTGDDDERDPIITSTDAADLVTLGSVEYFAGNVLSPGADVSVTFRLYVPEPCMGAFSTGQIYFWGEAI